MRMSDFCSREHEDAHDPFGGSGASPSWRFDVLSDHRFAMFMCLVASPPAEDRIAVGKLLVDVQKGWLWLIRCRGGWLSGIVRTIAFIGGAMQALVLCGGAPCSE